jgi:hypothetical protein
MLARLTSASRTRVDSLTGVPRPRVGRGLWQLAQRVDTRMAAVGCGPVTNPSVPLWLLLSVQGAATAGSLTMILPPAGVHTPLCRARGSKQVPEARSARQTRWHRATAIAGSARGGRQ